MRAYNLQPDKRVSIGLFVRHGTITLKQLQGTQQSSKLRRQKCIGVPCIVWDLQRSILSIVAEGSHFYDTRIGIGSAVASWIRHAGPDAEVSDVAFSPINSTTRSNYTPRCHFVYVVPEVACTIIIGVFQYVKGWAHTYICHFTPVCKTFVIPERGGT